MSRILGYNECPRVVRKKLLDFGLTPGTEIEVLRVAPMGDPVEIKARGFLLSLRKTEFEVLRLSEKSCVHCKKCSL